MKRALKGLLYSYSDIMEGTDKHHIKEKHYEDIITKILSMMSKDITQIVGKGEGNV